MGFLRGKGHVLRALAGVVLAIAAGGAPGAQRARASDGLDVQRAFAAHPSPGELRQRLAALDDAQVPRLFALAVTGELADPAGAAPVAITEEQRQLVRESLASRQRRVLVPFLEQLAARPLGLAERLEALALLGATGSGDHLRLLARLTLPAAERTPLSPELRSAFAAALESVLRRDVAALEHIPGYFSDSPAPLASSIVDALSRVTSREATTCLARLLGRSAGLDPLLLARLASRPERHELGDEFVLEAVRRYLHQREPLLVSAAAQASGALRDDAAVETLIELMEHPDERVRQSAFDALHRISGLAFGPDPGRWTSWYNAEMRWWEEESPALLARIERAKGVEFVRAARLVLEHRLFHDRMAESFTQALRRTNPDEVRLACRALEQLRSPRAVRALTECLDHANPRVRMAAWKALRSITGADLPPEADSWAALAG